MDSNKQLNDSSNNQQPRKTYRFFFHRMNYEFQSLVKKFHKIYISEFLNFVVHAYTS